jgi:putrescine transport system permease protein
MINNIFFNHLCQYTQKKLNDFCLRFKELQRRLVVILPYTWLFLFFLIPFFLIIKISFSTALMGVPPFSSVFEWASDNLFQIRLNFQNYLFLLHDPFYKDAFTASLKIAGSSTLCCLILGYMMAYGISRVPLKWRTVLLLLVALPFWTSFLIRVYAWMTLLSTQGLINTFLMKIGLIEYPLQLLDNPYAVCIGIVYCYLPFMVLPVYATLEKLDLVYVEAAFDLGCTPWRTFWKITVPLSKPGIIAGCILVFIPAIGELVIPEILGGPDTIMIGRALWWEFFNNRDWPLACALAVSMVLVFVVPIMIFQRQQSLALERGDK